MSVVAAVGPSQRRRARAYATSRASGRALHDALRDVRAIRVHVDGAVAWIDDEVHLLHRDRAEQHFVAEHEFRAMRSASRDNASNTPYVELKGDNDENDDR